MEKISVNDNYRPSTESVNTLNGFKSLKCFYTNAHSILNKIDELRLVADTEKPDIIIITESWTSERVSNAFLNIEGYRPPFRQDRRDTKKGCGGGVLIYVTDDPSIKVQEIFPPGHDSFTNSVWIQVLLPNKLSFITGGVYRSPNSSEENNESLVKMLEWVCRKKEVLIFGDFNLPNVDWDLLTGGNKLEQMFVDCFQEGLLTQHVEFPTRYNPDNILDLILTTDEELVGSVTTGGKLGASDHVVLIAELSVETNKPETSEQVYDFKKANWEAIKEQMRDVDWQETLRPIDASQAYQQFLDKVMHIIDSNIPKKNRRKRNRPLWASRGTMRIIRKKKKLFLTYSNSREYANYMEYKKMERNVNKEVRRSKRLFEQNLAKRIKDDPKAFFAYLNSQRKVKESVGPLKNKEGELITDELGMANILNEFFSSVFTEEDTSQMPEVEEVFTGTEEQQLKDMFFTESMISEKLRQLKPNKAPGPDNMYTNILRNLSEEFATPLSELFNRSMRESEVPRQWKDANVTPLFKKGSKQSPGNYRPVSLTSVICKTFETFLRDGIMKHLKEHSLLRDSQHGFRPHRSTVTNLLEFLDEVTTLVDEGFPVDIIYLDFAKAFDKVPHQRLILKLEAHGITGLISKWVEKWLSNRLQRVVLNGQASEWAAVSSGVPQGSVLGPVLFLIYINDIDNAVTSMIKKFADDTKLYRQTESDQEANELQEDLHRIMKWSEEWQMLFNTGKCKVMHVGFNNPKRCYTMGDNTLEEVIFEKDLGIIIDNTLKPSRQCAQAVKKANQVLGMVKMSLSCRSKEIILPIYKHLIRPHLEYAIQAWNPYLKKDIELIEGVQHRVTKLIPELRMKCYEDRLKALGLTTLETRRKRGDIIQMWKILHNIDDVDATKYFVRDVSSRRGHNFKLFKRRFNRDVRKYSFTNRLIDLWNKLPEEVVEAPTMNALKTELDKYIASKGGLL